MKKTKALLGFLMGIFAAVLFFALFSLISYYMGINEGQELYDELAQLVQEAKPTQPTVDATEPITSDPDATEPAPTEPQLVEAVSSETGETIMILPEYKPIYELNDDFVGWICIEGTNINFPVLYKPKLQDYYLDRNFYGEYSNQGAIYVREACDPFTPSDNVVIYGHRMMAGTMFAKLHEYKSKEFWQAHPYIQFDSLTEHRSFEILAVFSIDSTPDSDFLYHEFVNAANAEEFDTFVRQCKRYALYDTGVTAQLGDKLTTLSTCDGESGGVQRLVVVAKLVTE